MAKDRDEGAGEDESAAGTSTKDEGTAEGAPETAEAAGSEAKAEKKDVEERDAAEDDESSDDDEAAASAEDDESSDDDEADEVEGSEDDGEDSDEDDGEDSDGEDSDDEDSDDVEDSDEDDDEEDDREEKVAAKDAGPEPSQERTRLMILGAVLVGLIVVAVIAYTDGSGTDDEAGEDEITDATDEDMSAAEEAPPSDLLEQLAQQQQGPQPIPAPPDVDEPPADAQRSESGLAWKVIEQGTGTDHPTVSDMVTIHYTGWTTDGRMVDSSVARGEPAEVPLSRAVPGWKEGVPMMVVGEKRRFWVPPELANTGRGRPPGPITFDVELLAFEPAPAPPEPPRTVSGPPPNAQRTESGLAYRVLQRGTGTEHPSAQSRVRAHFTGWTTDGEMLDTSVVGGEPALLPSLQRVLPGMREGIQLMVVGEKRRLWIPEELAFNGRPGAPEGMLVFDIELVEILEPPAGHPMMPGMPGGHPPTGGAPPNHPPMPRGGGGAPPG